MTRTSPVNFWKQTPRQCTTQTVSTSRSGFLREAVRRLAALRRLSGMGGRVFGRTVSGWMLLAVCWLLPAGAGAQVAFNGEQATLFGGLTSPIDVAMDRSGSVYILEYGSSSVIKETLSNGRYTRTTVDHAGSDSISGLAVDGNGNLYISDTASGTVLKETPSGGTYTETTVAGGLTDPMALAVDGMGNVYVFQFVFGANQVALQVLKETPSGGTYTQTVVAGGFSGAGVNGLAADASGNVYISDVDTSSVIKESPFGGGYTQTTVAPGLESPSGLAVDGSGDVYVTDTGRQLVWKETLSAGTYIQTLVSADVSYPTGVAVDGAGNIFIADPSNSRIVEVQSSSVGFGAVDVGWTSAVLSLPFTVSAGTSVGSVAILTGGAAGQDFEDAGSSTCKAETYSADASCVLNVRFTPLFAGLRRGAAVIRDTKRNVLATVPLYGFANGAQAAYEPGTGTSLSSGLKQPGGLTVDDAGNVYIADTGNQRVVKVSAGGVETTVGSGLMMPTDVALDGAGNLYILDAEANLVKMVTPGGAETTVVGQPGVQLTNPQGLAVDAWGDIYIADTGNDRVLEVTAAGLQTMIGGSFIGPQGVAVDGAGNVYITAEHGLYEVTPQGVQTMVAGGLLGPLGRLTGIAVDSAGDLYFGVPSASTVIELTPDEQLLYLARSQAPVGVALDRYGNVYYTDDAAAKATKIERGNSPALNFAATPEGDFRIDIPQRVTVRDIGNAPLDFLDVTYPADFPDGAPGDPSGCYSFVEILPTGTCTLTVEFYPQAALRGTTSLELKESLQLETSQISVQPGPNGFTAGFTAQSVSLAGKETPPADTLVLSASNTSPTLGTVILLEAKAAGSIAATPTGTVTFSLGSNTLGSAPLISGVAKLAVGTLPLGVDSIGAVYAGNATYAQAKATPLVVTVAKAIPGVKLTLSKTSVALGTTVTFTASVSKPVLGIAVSGSVSFYADGNLLGKVPMISPSSAVFSTSGLGGLPHSITATYDGDSHYAAATSAAATLKVTPAKATLTVSSSLNPAKSLQAVTFTAVFAGAVNGFPPTGLVQFLDGGSAMGPPVSIGKGTASYSDPLLSVGTHSITATYLLDFNYAGVTSNAVSEVVNSGFAIARPRAEKLP